MKTYLQRTLCGMISVSIAFTSYLLPVKSEAKSPMSKLSREVDLVFQKLVKQGEIRGLEKQGALLTKNYLQAGLKLGDEVTPIKIPLATKEAIANYSPLNIMRRYREEVAKIGASEGHAWKRAQQESFARGLSKIMAETAERMPVESFYFFLGIGALNAIQLTLDSDANPTLMQQQVAGLEDPISHMGFMMFMQGNHLISQPLRAMQELPTLAKYSSYMGMSVGMLASSIVHELSHIPSMKGCFKEKEKTNSLEGPACEIAYNELTGWGEYGKTFILNQAPSLAAMLGSTFALAFVADLKHARKAMALGIRKAKALGLLKFKSGKDLAIVGIKLGALMNPGGILYNISLFTMQNSIMNTIAFTQVTNWMTMKLDRSWKEAWESGFLGGGLVKRDEYVSQVLSYDIQTNWNREISKDCVEHVQKVFNIKMLPKDCSNTLLARLKDLQDNLGTFRQASLYDVMARHDGWASAISKLAARYRSSRNFYSHLIGAIETYRLAKASKANHPIAMKFPLNGVNPKGFDGQSYHFLGNPEAVLDLQIQTINDAVASAVKQIQDKKVLEKLNLTDRSNLVKLINDLYVKPDTTPDLEKLGTALTRLSSLGSKGLFLDVMQSAFNPAIEPSKDVREIADGMLSIIGQPNPIKTTGLGFLQYTSLLNSYTDELNASGYPTDRDSGPLVWNQYHKDVETPIATEYLALQALFGPSIDSAREMNIDTSLGGLKNMVTKFQFRKQGSKIFEPNELDYLSEFIPPKIIRDDIKIKTKYPIEKINEMTRGMDLIVIYNGKEYSNPIDFLLNAVDEKGQSVIRPDFIKQSLEKDMVDKNGDIRIAWKKYLEEQYIGVWDDFATKYRSVIAGLVSALWGSNKPAPETFSNNDSAFNFGPISDTVVEAIQQERKLYLLILGEIMKSALTKEKISIEPLLSKQTEILPVNNYERKSSLLENLRLTNALDFTGVMTNYSPNKGTQNFIEQANIQAQFKDLEALLAKIRVIKIEDEQGKIETTVSSVSSAELKEKQESIDAQIDKLAFMLGLKLEDEEMQQEFIDAGITPISGTPDEHGQAKPLLNNYQMAVAQFCLDSLKGNSSELVNYGKIANAVSYKDNHNADGTVKNDYIKDVKKVKAKNFL